MSLAAAARREVSSEAKLQLHSLELGHWVYLHLTVNTFSLG